MSWGGFSLSSVAAKANIILSTLSLKGSSESGVYLARVVGSTELAGILATGQFSITGNPSGWEQKQFWTNIRDARWYATDGMKALGITEPVTIVETRVSLETAQMGYPFADAGHRALSFGFESLPFLNNDAAQSGIRQRETFSGQ